MFKYTFNKLIAMVVTIFVITVITFFSFEILPGDAAVISAGTNATTEMIEQKREEMGLNESVLKRYCDWIAGALKGDFGESLQYTEYEVNELLIQRVPYTVMLGVMSIIIVVAVSIPLGVFIANKKSIAFNLIVSAIGQVLMAVPEFFVGILVTYILGIILKLFQPGMYVSPTEDFFGALFYMIFPCIAVVIPKIAVMTRYVKNAVREQMLQDYVRTARAKGLSESKIMFKHVLKNAMIPVISFIALIIIDILAGSIIVEKVFGIPGMGMMLVTAISNRDYPVVQACVFYITIIVVSTNTIADLMYKFADPRVKPGKEGVL